MKRSTPPEPDAGQQAAADALYAAYVAYQRSGFTKLEAIRIIQSIATAAVSTHVAHEHQAAATLANWLANDKEA